MIRTDEFKEYGSEIKNLCSSCFLKGVVSGFGNYEIGNCDVCNSSLVLQHNNEETIFQAQDDYTVSFICKKLKNAIDTQSDNEIERIEKEEHDWLILYTIQPDPEVPEWG